jgi:hypothetical protein
VQNSLGYQFSALLFKEDALFIILLYFMAMQCCAIMLTVASRQNSKLQFKIGLFLTGLLISLENELQPNRLDGKLHNSGL